MNTLNGCTREVAQSIKNSGRPIVFSICNQRGRNYQNWAPFIGDSWRVGPDIDHTGEKSQWDGVIDELDLAAKYPEIAGPGHWNDADMMLVVVGIDGGRLQVVSSEERQSHFSMWCTIASPLLLGHDIRNLSKETLTILSNKEAIAINQDVSGVQGRVVDEQSPWLQVWLKQLYARDKAKRYAIALFNRTNAAAAMVLHFDKLGLAGKHKLRDVWLHKNLGKFANRYTSTIPAHGVQLLVLD